MTIAERVKSRGTKKSQLSPSCDAGFLEYGIQLG